MTLTTSEFDLSPAYFQAEPCPPPDSLLNVGSGNMSCLKNHGTNNDWLTGSEAYAARRFADSAGEPP